MMIANLLRTVWRAVTRQKLYTAISVFGLAVGLTVCILIAQFVRHEAAFESMHPGSENSYRLNWLNASTGAHFATYFNPVAPLLAQGLPEIESFSRLALNQHLVAIDGEQQYRNISFVDPGFFDLFSYSVQRGSTAAIEDLASVVLTEAAAMELFGTRDALGEVFTVDGQYDFQVGAVVANNPSNTHLISNIYVNIENVPVLWGFPSIWDNVGSDVMYSYVRLLPGSDPLEVGQKSKQYLIEDLNLPPDFATAVDILLQPVKDIHLNSDLQNEMSVQDDMLGTVKPQRRPGDVLVFLGVALLTLAIAIFNFVNLQIVQSYRRAREIAVRRIIGTPPPLIASHSLLETSLLSLAAMVLALAFAYALTPLFGNMVSVPLRPVQLFAGQSLVLALFTGLLLGLIAGTYPALTSMRMNTVTALHGEFRQGAGTSRFRAGLIVIQFAISIGLMVSCAVVNKQIGYAMNKELGFDPRGVIALNMRNSQAREAYQSLHDQLLAEPNIVAVSAGSILPTQSLSDGSLFYRGDNGTEPALATRRISTSAAYFDVLGMDMVAGRAFSDSFGTDTMPAFGPDNPEVTGGLILNETAARAAGWANPAAAVGQEFFSAFDLGTTRIRMNYRIVGIVNDAHYGSVRTEIGPVSYTLDDFRNQLIIRLAAPASEADLARIDAIWAQNVPDFPVRRSFLADSYSAFYAGESNTFLLFMGFASIAVLIACLGLYGLASFIAQRRTREIGIRKVLGATVTSIAGLLAWDFSKLVIVANLLAWPAAWWLMQDWLTSFAYRTDIDLAAFFLAGLAAFLLALLTTFQRTYIAAVSNPVDALRVE